MRQCYTSLSVPTCCRTCPCKSCVGRTTTINICNTSKLLQISRQVLYVKITCLKTQYPYFLASFSSYVGGAPTSFTLFKMLSKAKALKIGMKRNKYMA